MSFNKKILVTRDNKRQQEAEGLSPSYEFAKSPAIPPKSPTMSPRMKKFMSTAKFQVVEGEFKDDAPDFVGICLSFFFSFNFSYELLYLCT
ncbi:hypothetical protein FH972_011835 [Carpinus fangiana]|uniref:Uncharacterized protein n=1 Tax=Carpinus fangiana TaxID=176857 RepID=A0A660KSH6_9ROSI|nr:hypothetical protein FH972_011835 [Carpinus fangiana]